VRRYHKTVQLYVTDYPSDGTTILQPIKTVQINNTNIILGWNSDFVVGLSRV
jgi:hypothetical protein